MTTVHSTVVAVADDGTSPVGTNEWNAAHVTEGAVELILDGAGSEIVTGIKADIVLPYAGTFTSWTLLADVAGSIVLDIWRDTYANYPPLVGDTIIPTGTKPTLSSATKATSSTPTGWTTTFAAGDVLRVNVDSVSTVTRVLLSLGTLS